MLSYVIFPYAVHLSASLGNNMERIFDPQLNIAEVQTLLNEIDWENIGKEEKMQAVKKAAEQGAAILEVCLSTGLPVRTIQLEMWAEAGCAALKAQKPAHFLTIVEKFPGIMNVQLEEEMTCYKAILASESLETLLNCLKITKEVSGTELFQATFPGFQKLAWKQAFNCQFELIKDLSSLLPSKFPLYRLKKSKETLLNEAVRSASVPCLQAILTAKLFPMDMSNNIGMTGLMTAIQRAAADLEQRIQALLEAGCNPLDNDIWMNSAFHYLLQSSKIATVRHI